MKTFLIIEEIKPSLVQPDSDAYFDAYNKGAQWNWWSKDHKQFLEQIIICPFGKVGDIRDGAEITSIEARQLINYKAKTSAPWYWIVEVLK